MGVKREVKVGIHSFRLWKWESGWAVLCLVVLLLTSCSKREAKDHVDTLPEIFPDYIDVTVPENICPMNFSIPDAEYVRAIIKNERGETIDVSDKDHVEIPERAWHELIKGTQNIDVTVSAWNSKHPEGVTYKPFTISIVKDEINPWIAYRLLPPGYESWNRMGIYQRNLTNFDVEPIIENSQNNKGCVNCHSFANYDPKDFTFHARGKNGGTIVMRDGKMKKVDIKEMSGGRHGSYNIWHPSKRYIAFSSNSTHQSFYGQSKNKIEVYDLWSDLIVYDIDNEKVLQDERFTDSLNLEMFPSFSPDGKWLYFSTAKPVNMPMETDKLHYSIVRVPFDEKTGKLGEIDTVYSAYEQGGTAMMPRITPDGRYMLFSLGECGGYNLYHMESDLKMMDLQTRKMIPTDILNSPRAESFHAWNSNGKWMIYVTKRFDGRYTRLMLVHWDGKKFHKPFLLPQQNPEENTLLMMAYNVPEFITAPVVISKDDLAELFTK
ncbi:MAG: PD40 domain-containing protein [Bacteroidaceae bacterium]|nr:PD40 domain-containing protein [Bacteroidaceae bacterium]